jgi:hypothetical protein
LAKRDFDIPEEKSGKPRRVPRKIFWKIFRKILSESSEDIRIEEGGTVAGRIKAARVNSHV